MERMNIVVVWSPQCYERCGNREVVDHERSLGVCRGAVYKVCGG